MNKLTNSAALRHLSSVTSSTVPWTSIRSRAWLSTWIAGSRISLTSLSLLALPVMKLTKCRAWVGAVGSWVAIFLLTLGVSFLMRVSSKKRRASYRRDGYVYLLGVSFL